MKKAVDHTLHEFSTIHTGKATPAMVEGVMVEAYGSHDAAQGLRRHHHARRAHDPDPAVGQRPLQAPSRRPSRRPTSASIPIVDGKLIRLPFPDLSRERRQEFVKTANRLAEEGRVARAQRPPRRPRSAKKQRRTASCPRTKTKRLEKDIQTATDKSIKDIDTDLAHKEKDLMTV